MSRFKIIEKQIEKETKEAEKAMKEKLMRAALGVCEPPVTFVNQAPIEDSPEPPMWFPFDLVLDVFEAFGAFLKNVGRRLRCELYCGHWDCPVHYPE